MLKDSTGFTKPSFEILHVEPGDCHLKVHIKRIKVALPFYFQSIPVHYSLKLCSYL